MTNPPHIQYWDSCLFIELLTGLHPERIKIVKQLIEESEKGNIQIVLSNFHIVEIRPTPREKWNGEERELVESFLETDRSHVRFFGLTRNIAARARDIAKQFPQISNPDAIHLVTAIEAKAEVFFTYDGSGQKDKKRKRSRDLLALDGKVGNPPLSIKTPNL